MELNLREEVLAGGIKDKTYVCLVSHVKYVFLCSDTLTDFMVTRNKNSLFLIAVYFVSFQKIDVFSVPTLVLYWPKIWRSTFNIAIHKMYDKFIIGVWSNNSAV